MKCQVCQKNEAKLPFAFLDVCQKCYDELMKAKIETERREMNSWDK